MTDAPHSWKQRLRHYWPVIPLGLIMLFLVVEELDNMGYTVPWRSDPCSLQEIDQGEYSTKAYLPLVNWALRTNPNPDVAIIYIDPTSEPPEVITNTCASRILLSRLIYDLNTLQAKVIVIDKYYSAGSCTDEDTSKIFLKATDETKVPVIVGQPTKKLTDTSKSDGCLAVSDRFEFDKQANVQYGLTRLNSDTRKIPLRWPVFQENSKGEATRLPDYSGDTISLIAARQKKPHINDDVESFLTAGQHPYTNFLNLPTVNAIPVACNAETLRPYPNGPPLSSYVFSQPTKDPCQGKIPLVDSQGNKLDLTGKIVVIGDKSDIDMQPFPGGDDRPGTWFQANYIQSLLDRRFLREIPITLTIACLIAFITIVYMLFWRTDNTERALFISMSLLAALIVLTIFVLRKYNYFTPLWALWGGGLMVVVRYLETKGHHLSHPNQHEHSEPKK